MSEVDQRLAAIHRQEWGNCLALAMRIVRDIELAEDVVQDAFAIATERWRSGGIPPEPAAWLMTTVKNRSIDAVRRRGALSQRLPLLIVDALDEDVVVGDDSIANDEQLRLMLLCCHPALPFESRAALTLRLVCGLTVHQIARLFLTQDATIAARITRAKRKIQVAGIPFRLPEGEQLSRRLNAVLSIVYLVYTEGHTATSGAYLRSDNAVGLATHLAKTISTLQPDNAEALGLRALMVLSEARHLARLSPDGDVVLLQDQDRSRWDAVAIAQGVAMVERALTLPRPGPFAIQAAISAIHAEATSWEDTDWQQIVGLYHLLMLRQPSPVIALARAVAIGMADGPESGLEALEQIAARPLLDEQYPMFHVARGDMFERAGDVVRAQEAYVLALDMIDNAAVRRSVEERIERIANSR